MKSKTLMALAVAGTFACGGAIAGPFHMHQGSSGMQNGAQASSYEAITPSSVSESAPWLANQAHSAGWTGNAGTQNDVVGMRGGDEAVGASSSIGGYGSGGFDSLSMSDPKGYDASIYGLDYSLNDTGGVDYWLLGDDSNLGTGVSSSVGGSGSLGFDSLTSVGSSQSFDSSSQFDSQASLGNTDEYGTTDYYMISGPLSQFNPSTAPMYEASADDASFLASPPDGVWVITPIYDSIVDPVAALEGSDMSDQQVSQYSSFGSDEDSAT